MSTTVRHTKSSLSGPITPLSIVQLVIRVFLQKFANTRFFAVLLFAYWLSGAIKKRNITPLRHIPGPWLAPFSRIFSIINIATAKQMVHYRNWHEKYGHMVRVGKYEHMAYVGTDLKQSLTIIIIIIIIITY
jgi:hypothetical protein